MHIYLNAYDFGLNADIPKSLEHGRKRSTFSESDLEIGFLNLSQSNLSTPKTFK